MTTSSAAPGQAGDTAEKLLVYIVKEVGRAKAASQQLVDPFIQFYAAGDAISPPLNPDHLLDLSQENAIHAACLDAKAADAVGHGWDFKKTRKRADQGRRDAVKARLAELCVELPFDELLMQAASEQQMIGWAAWETPRVAGPGSELGAIYPLPAHTLRATKRPGVYVQLLGGEVRYFVAFGSDLRIDAVTGEEHEIKDPANEIILFKSYSPFSPWYGVPRWVSAIPALCELTAIREYNLSLFASGGLADRLLTVKAEDRKVAETLAAEIQHQFEDAAGRGHITLVTAGSLDLDVQIDFLSQREADRDGQFMQRREDLIREVLMAHCTPPYRVGWAEMGSLGGSAAREMLRTYRLGAIEPIQKLLETKLNATLFGPHGLHVDGYRFELTDIDWEQVELNLEIAVRAVQLGLLSLNEGRGQLGYDPIDKPEFDDHYIAVNLERLEDLAAGLGEQARQRLKGKRSTPRQSQTAGTTDPATP